MGQSPPHFIVGRGSQENISNRFELLAYETSAEWDAEPFAAPKTTFYKDTSKTILTSNDSPDVGFEASINPYRGCEHGCSYCYARPTHEYLGFSAGLDFESKIMVKEKAPELLRQALLSEKYTPKVLAMSGVTDCYQPIERSLRLTRRCLEVLVEFRNPVSMITKNHLVTRDIDLLTELASHRAAQVYLSVTTLDGDLARILEPRASHPQKRLEAIEKLSRAGVPVGVLMAPVIPGLTDQEIVSVLKACREAGALTAGHVVLRLPGAVAPLFEKWLREHRPERAEKVLNRLRSLRGGKLNDPRFGSRMRGEGPFAESIHALFDVAVRKAGFPGGIELSTSAFRRPPSNQLSLF